jgi:hypothetical protein
MAQGPYESQSLFAQFHINIHQLTTFTRLLYSAHVNSKLHKLLGDCLSKTNKSREAAAIYQTALNSTKDEQLIGLLLFSICNFMV